MKARLLAWSTLAAITMFVFDHLDDFLLYLNN
jgi:hypothetical protein